MQEKKTRRHRARHNFWWHVMRGLIGVYCRVKYKFRTERLDNKKRPYLILYNHQTAIDPLMVCLAAKRLTYMVCTEDLYAMGAATAFIKHAAAPIAFKKSMTDVMAVRASVNVAREGYSIALSPEGNRTFDGVTCHINPSVAKLAKTLKMPVAIYKITGGYGVHPRYADKPRRGPEVRGKIACIIEPEQYLSMSNGQLYELIRRELYVDESEGGAPVKSGHRAEFMERALYWCPACDAVGKIEGRGNAVVCRACNCRSEVDAYGRFKGGFPVRNLKNWLDMQSDWVRALELEKYIGEPLTVDGGVLLRKLCFEKGKKEVIAKDAEVKLFGDRMEIDEKIFAFSDISAVAACGRNRVDFYVDGTTYQLSCKRPLSILKYTNVYYRYKNTKENDDGFLGI